MATERRLGFEPTDRELDKLGLRHRETGSGPPGRSGFSRSRGAGATRRPLRSRRNEILYSLNKPDDFILAIVEFPRRRDDAEWFVSGLDLAADDKTLTEAVIGAVIVEAAEMVGASRANLTRMKAFITRQNDGHLRLAYRRDREPCPRRAVIVGTANPSTAGILPNDPPGLTRFVVIDLPADRSLVGSVEDWIGQATRPALGRGAAPLQRQREGEPAGLSAHRCRNRGGDASSARRVPGRPDILPGAAAHDARRDRRGSRAGAGTKAQPRPSLRAIRSASARP